MGSDVPGSHTGLLPQSESTDLSWDPQQESCTCIYSLFPVQKLWIALGIILDYFILIYEINLCRSPPNRIASLLTQATIKNLIPHWSQKTVKKKSRQDKTQFQSTLAHEQPLEPSLALIQTCNMWYPPPITQNIQECSALAFRLLNQTLSWEAWILK